MPEIIAEEEISPEVEAQLIELWQAFDAIEKPSADQLDQFLTGLLAMPAESVNWSEVIHLFGRREHPDLSGPFRRIAATASQIDATNLQYFYWAAAEEAHAREVPELLLEIGAGFQRLDPKCLEIEILEFILGYLLAAGFDVAARTLAEHALPVMKHSGEKVSGTSETWPGFVFRLRVGDAIRARRKKEESPKSVLEGLQRGLETKLDSENARRVAALLNDPAAAPEVTRESFDLVKPITIKAAEIRKETRRMNHVLIEVAREAWEVDKRAPGAGYWALFLTLESVYQWKTDGLGKSKKGGDNLLDFLRPSELEARVLHSSRDVLGINQAQAVLLLQGHEILTRFAVRHALISAGDASGMERRIEELKAGFRRR